MRVVITDLLTAECELTGKANVECVRVQLDESTPEMVIQPNEMIRLLRFKKKQTGMAMRSAEKKGGAS